ncbi:thermonuclease family protein [Domibacillus robiginosus]|uniref:thermonuclease family protein n=1 Tax=Domibacillus robiginosus TaxID=1071054 RepID=UPI00067B1F85|nr:thermonuclease family protein [Domibacillus robiginosus]
MKRRVTLILCATAALFLSACSLEEVSDVLEVTEDVLTAIEKENQQTEKGSNKAEEPVDEAGSILKTKGVIEPIPAKLVRPVDGDTAVFAFDADNDGKAEEFSARFLLIDTPETRHPQLGRQPLGEEAKERTAELLQGGDITIEFDIGQRLDKYSRILVYVYVNGKSVQETLLEEGFARVAYVYPPNTRYLNEFETKEGIAKKKKKGIWSMEGYVTDRGFNSK